MALGKHQPVTVLPAGIAGVHPQHLAVQIGDKIGNRKGAAGVSRFGGMHFGQDTAAHLSGRRFQLFQFPWYLYGYVVLDFLKHFVKGIMPEWLYLKFHRKAARTW